MHSNLHQLKNNMHATDVSITKSFADLPFAHRQHLHKGHCSLIHGHNWTFDLTFVCDQLDENGFIVDFGKLRPVRKWLEEKFDHTLVLNATDPWLGFLKFHLVDVTDPNRSENGCRHLAKVTVVPNCGAEGLGAYVLDGVNRLLAGKLHIRDDDWVSRGLRVSAVTVHEDGKNSATVRLP